MSDSALWVTGLMCFAAVVLAWRAASRWRLLWRERRWLPAELRTAKLVFAEKMFVDRHLALVARVDRAYELDGQLFLLELKTRRRHQVHESDVIELSAQKVAMQATCDRLISSIGYVLTQVGSDERRMHRVTLMPARDVVQLIERRRKLLDCLAEPRCTVNTRLCASCLYRSECGGRDTYPTAAGAGTFPYRAAARRE